MRDQLPIFVGLESFVNRPDRTHGNASAAIDADIRINVAALIVDVETLNRAMLDAIGKETKSTIIRNDVGHVCLQSVILGGRFLTVGRPSIDRCEVMEIA
jgi:hypothetical protein